MASNSAKGLSPREEMLAASKNLLPQFFK